ncbi:hypothetical protein DL762_005978 [Monosporascus cannonballus]|uniref:DUF3752 domain-containing protein n=1 Tax=Monosporascus cannonballus TaxID=155416 RepID=A0ABY0H6P7_9PEZI|nr:hypothetical protein DL762_005978 [Monosporascus cannonballus]
MASIGPQLPPHVPKRKRDSDDEAVPGSPPAKVHATEDARVGNENEVSLGYESDNDDDEFGPSAAPQPAPEPKPKPRPSTGPTLPASVAAANADEIALDSEADDDDEAVGPAPAKPPPPSASSAAIGPSAPSPTRAGTTKRIHGPAPPPGPLSEMPTVPPSAPTEDSGSESDDDYGPALPTSPSHQQRHRQAERLAAASAALDAASAGAPRRDDWMLAPPTSGGAYRVPDPTKLKNRKFASGPRAGGAAGSGGPSASGGGGEISSIWTETPEEKRRRLEDAVLGRGDGGGPQQRTQGPSVGRRGAADARPKTEDEKRIREYTESTRGRSLYEEHQLAKGGRGGKIEEEDDDPSKRAFDREKDMKLGGRIGTAQRRELLNKAADFGGRFSKGKYL